MPCGRGITETKWFVFKIELYSLLHNNLAYKRARKPGETFQVHEQYGIVIVSKLKELIFTQQNMSTSLLKHNLAWQKLMF